MFIVDEINILFLKLLFIIDSQLSQAKEKKDNDIAVPGGLTLVIIIKNFYQFPPKVRKFLQNKTVTSKKNHNKRICNHFIYVITLTKQIRQYDNQLFQTMLTKEKRKLLNNDNVAVFNSKVATTMPIQETHKNIIIV